MDINQEKSGPGNGAAPPKGEKRTNGRRVVCFLALTLLSLYILAEIFYFAEVTTVTDGGSGSDDDVDDDDDDDGESTPSRRSSRRPTDKKIPTNRRPTDNKRISMNLLATSGRPPFPGAREWNDFWIDFYHHRRHHATNSNNDEASTFDRNSSGSSSVRAPPLHAHDEYVASAAESAAEATSKHVDEMRRRYEGVNASADFYARGLGWIRDRLDMALTVVVAGDHRYDEKEEMDDNNHSSDDGEIIALRAGPVSIFVVDTIGNVKCGGSGGKNDDDDDPSRRAENHPPLTMWVRSNGPEIFAGTAIPHVLKLSSDDDRDRRCAWRYDFEPRSDGIYSIHVKALTFNGFAETRSVGDCGTERIPSRNDRFDRQEGNGKVEGDLEKLEAMNSEVVGELAELGNYTHHRGVSGFKMYGEIDACCEACTRTRNCKMWSAPGAGHYDNCELYFDRLEDDVDFSDREDGHYFGRDRDYSYIEQKASDFPSVRRRLSIHGAGNATRRKLAVSPYEITKIWPNEDPPSKGVPRAGAATPFFLGCGWSSLMSFESPCHYPSDDLIFGSGQKISITNNTSAVKDPPSCTIEDERLDTSGGRWVRYPYPDDSKCGIAARDDHNERFRDHRYKYRSDRNPTCWYRDDLTKIATGCAEPGCQFLINHRWATDLKKESKWFGMWEPHDCGYRVMGDDEIQQCIVQKNISKIEAKGASIKTLLDAYLSQKLRSINMTKREDGGTREVFLDSLKMPHLLWHKSVDEHRTDLERDFPDVTDSENEHYWVTGFYYTSEREPNVLVDRSLKFSKVAWNVLTPKGYKMINGFDLTAAFAFDTDGQADGLHISGPPARAIVTNFLHHLCHDVSMQKSQQQLSDQE